MSGDFAPGERPIEQRDLTRVLEAQARHQGEKPWIIAPDGTLSFAAALERSRSLAADLSLAGARPGKTVLIMLGNGLPFVLTWCALARIGALEVCLNGQLRGAPLAHQIKDSRAVLAVVEAGFLETFLAANNEGGRVRKVIVCGDPPPELDSGPVALSSWQEFAHAKPPPVDLPAAPCYRDLLAVMYTSGTTGPAKGVMITHAHAYEYALSVVELLDLRAEDRYLCVLPLFHIAGQWAGVYACLQSGTTCVLTDRFSATTFWEEARHHRGTCSFLLGAMAQFLMVQDPDPVDGENPMERLLVVPLIPEIEAFMARFSVRVSATWGSTEVNVPTRSGFDLPDARTCGFVAEDRYEVRIVDDNDMEVPPGVPGEAVVRAKQPWTLMAGYWNQPEATAAAWRNLWLHSGDMMMRGENGWLYFVDRKSDSLRRRGENISSIELENEINAHPGVEASAVIPIPAAATEDDIMALVTLKPGHQATPEALIAFLEPRLARFQLPRYIEMIDELPKTATGKIQKYSLRARGVTAATWDREKS